MAPATPSLLLPFNAAQQCLDDRALPQTSWPNSEDLAAELSMADLNAIHGWLSIAGSLDHYVALHHQLVLQREIIASDDARLHMLWFERVIYIKPLPSSLMNAAFFSGRVCSDRQLHKLAMGFLFSYCRMINSRLDLDVAHERCLLTKEITWEKWEPFQHAILSHAGLAAAKNRRYLYGELRIPRLNWIYRLTLRGWVYFTTHREYGTYFSQYFALFITGFAFATTILQAMQVVLANENHPKPPPSFAMASYVFSIATLVGIAAALVFVALLFSWMFIVNAYITARAQIRYRHSR
jgi:hypothetical protein